MIFTNFKLKPVILEALFAVALATILFDRFRFGGRIGIGEVILAMTVYASLIIAIVNYRKINLDNLGIKYVLALITFLLFCIAPNTILNSWLGLQYKSSLSDVIAYTSCFFFIASISFLKLNHNKIAAFCITIVGILTLAFIGNTDAWYGDVRFSGGSDNPNRLAIYLLSSVALLAQLNIGSLKKLFFFTILSIFIYITLSDAARLGYIAMLLTFLFITGYRSPFILPIYIAIGILTLFWVTYNFEAIINFFVDLWYAASTSDYRVNLLIFGVNAWLESPLSFLIGHGAGAFSGFAGPFEGWEAHSTPIDTLTIGGIFLFGFFYCPLIYSIFRFIKLKNNFAASCLVGFIIFSLFAYVGRHPIVWFVIYCSLMNCKTIELKN
tara:strand:- start:718 stop:1863 length:1146 start_codon:yes stop_codon:yes gene_type:complete